MKKKQFIRKKYGNGMELNKIVICVCEEKEKKAEKTDDILEIRN